MPLPHDKELVMYSRTMSCPFLSIARQVLGKQNVPYRELFIDRNPEYERRVVAWTGFRSIPTLIIARPGEEVPYEEPAPLKTGESPRGINRGSMLTEANEDELLTWLRQHGFVE